MLFLKSIIISLAIFFSISENSYALINVSPLNIEQDISSNFALGKQNDLQDENQSLKLGYFNGYRWASLTLKNSTNENLNKYIYFDSLTGFIDLYSSASLKLIATTGSSIPYLTRSTPSIFAAFSISTPPLSQQKFSIRIKTPHNFNSKVYLGSLDTLLTKEVQKMTFIDFYIGGILSLIIYNFFIFVFLKDKDYLYYCLFSFSFMLTILNIHGLLDKFFQFKSLSISHHLISFSAITLFFATLFTFNFLKIKSRVKKINNFYQAILALSIFLFFIGMTPLEFNYPQFFGLLIDITLVTANLVFIGCAIHLYTKSNSARFYLYSWIFVGFSLLSWFGMTFGIIPNNFFSQHSLLYANLGQMLILSLALAFRINKVTQEKLEAEVRALQKDKYQRLVRVLSHDIANSLTIINTYSNFLVTSKNLEPKTHKIMEKIFIAAENIKNILTNVREEELLTELKKEMQFHPVNIYETIQLSAIVFEEKLLNKNIKLVIDVPENLEIMANKTCVLNNIINNIISNSIKFSFPDSSIEISTQFTTGNIALIFRDYGRGIDPELIQDIFFSQKLISSDGTQAEKGNGFGTTLMREYVELFGGKLEVRSFPKLDNSTLSGTTLKITFPVST